MMEYEFHCVCGIPPTHMRVFVNPMVEIHFIWKCEKCHRNLIVKLPIEELIADVPIVPKLLTAQSDTDFLHSIGVSNENG